MPTSTTMFDAGQHSRAKIGFVLLATEQTIEENVFRLCPDGVGMHFTRAASTLLPDGSLDVISYGCTSGSLVIGEDRVFAELNKGAPTAIATSLITGVIRALQAVGAKRIAVATPLSR